MLHHPVNASEGEMAMSAAARNLALAAALATLATVILAEGAGADAGCAVPPPSDMRTQQQAGAPATAGGPVQSGPEGRRAPQPSGSIPADAAIRAAPEARLTLSGSNFGAALPAPCSSPTPAAAAGTAHKTRSNIQNN